MVELDRPQIIQYGACAFHAGQQPFNAELNPICHLLALLGAHHILHTSKNKLCLVRAREILAVSS